MAEDGLMYHYCSTESFISILKSKELWLSSVYDTNDTTEFKETRERYIKLIKAKFSGSVFSDFTEGMIKELTNPTITPYIFCFSKDGDLLSQWRGYGDHGHGVAIGFDASRINIPKWSIDHTINNSNCTGLSLVEYNNCENAISGNFVDKVVRFHEDGLNMSSASLDHAISGCSIQICRISAKTKHAAFTEEQEERIIHFPCTTACEGEKFLAALASYPSISMRSGFRVARGRVVKYYSYQFPIDSIRKIITGPMYGREHIGTLKEYLGDMKMSDIEVVGSACPYRD